MWLSVTGLVIRPRKTTIRPEAVRLRWSDKASVQEEGKDNQEGRFEIRMHCLQDQGTIGVEAMQAL